MGLKAADLSYLRQGVQKFRTELFPARRALYENLADAQNPMALFVTCSDSRIEPSVLTGSEAGQLFVERNPGNIIPVYDHTVSIGVSSSIEYAIAVLGVQDVIVCGHSNCGAMKGLLHPEKLAKIPATERWLKYGPAPEKLQQACRATDEIKRLNALIKFNVIEQMSHLHTHPAVEERFRTGKLGVFGWFYEIHTGTVELYNEVTGEFESWPS